MRQNIPTMQKGRRANRSRPFQVWYRGLHPALHMRTIYSMKNQKRRINSLRWNEIMSSLQCWQFPSTMPKRNGRVLHCSYSRTLQKNLNLLMTKIFKSFNVNYKVTLFQTQAIFEPFAIGFSVHSTRAIGACLCFMRSQQDVNWTKFSANGE